MVIAAKTINGLKRRAKQIKRAENIPHCQALDMASQEAGFNNYKDALEKIPAQENIR